MWPETGRHPATGAEIDVSQEDPRKTEDQRPQLTRRQAAVLWILASILGWAVVLAILLVLF